MTALHQKLHKRPLSIRSFAPYRGQRAPQAQAQAASGGGEKPRRSPPKNQTRESCPRSWRTPPVRAHTQKGNNEMGIVERANREQSRAVARHTWRRCWCSCLRSYSSRWSGNKKQHQPQTKGRAFCLRACSLTSLIVLATCAATAAARPMTSSLTEVVVVVVLVVEEEEEGGT